MIAIVASHDLWPSPNVADHLIELIMREEGEEIGVRIDKKMAISSHLEAAVIQICGHIGRSVIVFPPEGSGRASVFDRDFALVGKCRKVYAYFAPGQEMLGGTGHVVKAALDKAVDVEAYRLNDQGEIELLGSHEESDDH